MKHAWMNHSQYDYLENRVNFHFMPTLNWKVKLSTLPWDITHHTVF